MEPSRPYIGEAKLSAAASDVAYEFNMLHEALALFPFRPLLNPAFNNFMVEAFLVHYRNLRDFLYPPKYYTAPTPGPSYENAVDCVLAHDYTSKWDKSRPQWEPVISRDVADEDQMINRKISHISYSRQTLPQEWPMAQMYAKMEREFREFLNVLPLERCRWFCLVSGRFPDVQW